MKEAGLNVKLLDVRSFGNLCFLEGERDFPFQVKRVYFIHSEKAGAHRGFHAHKSLKQVLVCLFGEIKIILDDGNNKAEVLLNEPTRGLLLPEMIWREMIWEKDDSILCVLASDYFDENDYIRDYDEFLEKCLCK